MESSGHNTSSNTSTGNLPYFEQEKSNRILKPLVIQEKLKFKQVYVLEEPKFLEKVKEHNKYEVKQYEVTMLI